jgi:hypothetical protein
MPNMQKNTARPRETATQAFYREVSELKPRLPKDWKNRFVQKYPDYDTIRGGVILHNVINGASTDAVVLAGIREIISDYETQKQ